MMLSPLITQLDITKEVTAMEKWLARRLVVEGNPFDTTDNTETALSQSWLNHDWIVRVLSRFLRYLMHFPDSLKGVVLAKKRIKTGNHTLKVSPPTGGIIEAMHKVSTHWYILKGIHIVLQKRQTVWRMLRRWSEDVQRKLACANFERECVCYHRGR